MRKSNHRGLFLIKAAKSQHRGRDIHGSAQQNTIQSKGEAKASEVRNNGKNMAGVWASDLETWQDQWSGLGLGPQR